MTIAEIAPAPADYSANALFYVAPVQRGLTGIYLLGGDAASTARNLAGPDKPSAAIIGAPTYQAGYASLKSKSNYPVTMQPESTALSAIFVVRSLDTFDGNSNTPAFFSNFGYDTLAGQGAISQQGVRITASSTYPGDTPPTAGLTLGVSMNNGGTISRPTAPALVRQAYNTWRAMAVIVRADGSTSLRNLTAGQSANLPAQAGVRELNTTQTLLLGSDGPGGSLAGTCDMAAAVTASVDWTDAEITAQYQWIKALVAKRDPSIVI